MTHVLASCRAQTGFFTSDDIFWPPSLSPFRKVLEFEHLFFYVTAPYRSLSVLPRDPCSCISVITSNPHRMLLRGNSSTFAGWQRPSCMHSMMSPPPCLILGRQHQKHMGPWPSTFKDCAYSTREASPYKGGWKNIEELPYTLGTRLQHKRDTGIAQVFTKITLARRHSFT